MSNTLTPYDPGPGDDDGYRGSLGAGRLIKGSVARWSDAEGWQDRDGIALPSPLFVPAIREVLQRWKDSRPEVIDALPLPNPDDLNSAIPVKEWETGLDGNPRPPWAHTVVAYLIDPSAGGTYTFASPTIGAHIAVDQLRESVATMRILRGARVMPLVNLSERPMKTKFGMKTRPHFEIVDWKTPGDRTALPTDPPPSQLPGAAAHAPDPEPAAPAPEPAPAAAPAASTRRRAKSRIKSQVRLAEDTLTAMGDVTPAEGGEILNDELPF
jgi:hypothetical protein